MSNKDQNPFDQVTTFWEKLAENYSNWHKSAEDFWTTYTKWLEDVFMHRPTDKK